MSFSLSYSIFNFSSPSLYSASLSMYVPFLFFHLSKVILLKISVAPAILSRHITKRLFSSVNILRTRSPSLFWSASYSSGLSWSHLSPFWDLPLCFVIWQMKQNYVPFGLYLLLCFCCLYYRPRRKICQHFFCDFFKYFLSIIVLY